MEHSGRGTDSYSFLKNAEVEVGKINDRTERSAARLDLLEMFLVLYVKEGLDRIGREVSPHPTRTLGRFLRRVGD